MTLIGAICFVILKLFRYEHSAFQYAYFIEIGKGWGGVSMGPFIFISKTTSHSLLKHEFGHSLQNCYFGPAMVLISIASAVRYFSREFGIGIKKLPDYDCIWFEGTATYLGKTFVEKK